METTPQPQQAEPAKNPDQRPSVSPLTETPDAGPREGPAVHRDALERIEKIARKSTSTERVRKCREAKRAAAEAERAAARASAPSATPATVPAEPARPADPRTDDELARDLGLLFAFLLWPVIGFVARRLDYDLAALSDREAGDLGKAFIPLARKFPVLAWLSRATAPLRLVATVRSHLKRRETRPVAVATPAEPAKPEPGRPELTVICGSAAGFVRPGEGEVTNG